jgi:hypothetical protein
MATRSQEELIDELLFERKHRDVAAACAYHEIPVDPDNLTIEEASELISELLAEEGGA